MIVITSAHAGAGRRSGSAEMRVCAVVIAHSPCLPRSVLSSRGPPFWVTRQLETSVAAPDMRGRGQLLRGGLSQRSPPTHPGAGKRSGATGKTPQTGESP